jgi:hypothetical protein
MQLATSTWAQAWLLLGLAASAMERFWSGAMILMNRSQLAWDRAHRMLEAAAGRPDASMLCFSTAVQDAWTIWL